jgi:ABC-type glycerol-3-phosphate transport system permease component
MKIEMKSRKFFISILRTVILYLVIGIGAFIFTLPFLWMISTSLKPEYDIFVLPPKWIPNPPLWENYPKGWSILPFNLFLKNTLIIVVNNLIGNLISCSLVAYGFARLRHPLRDTLFMLLISTMMIPYSVTMIPLFILYNKLGWINTFKPLMVPPWFGYPFFIFLLRQFFMGLPKELDEAAKIDGCSNWRIYWNIILPLSKPALATVAIFSFLGNWNDFLGPLIYLSSQEKYTIAIGLNLFRGQYFTYMGYMMAVSVLTVLPVIVIFLLAQQYFIRGIVMGGLKG